MLIHPRIKKFGTLYPYGGNDRLDTPYLDAVEHFESGKPIFNLFSHVMSCRKRNPSNQTVESPSPTEVIQRIKRSKRDGQNYRHLAKILINGSHKSSVCELLKLSGEIDDKWLRNIIVDLCRHYFCRETVGDSASENKRYIVFTYTNRYIEDVNLAGIVNKLETKSLYPSTSLKFVPTFSYSAPIRGKVLNYARTLMSEDPIPDSCEMRMSW